MIIREPVDGNNKRQDGRSSRVRRWWKLYRQFADEIGVHPERMSEGQKALLASLVDCTIQAELQRERICANQVVDPLATTRLARTIKMLSTQLRLNDP
jgi:hypothetical protein